MNERVVPTRVVNGSDTADRANNPGDRRVPLTAADVMTAQEVAELLRIPVGTVHDYARRGVLPSQKLGRHRRFIRDRVIAAIEAADGTRQSPNVVPTSGTHGADMRPSRRL